MEDKPKFITKINNGISEEAIASLRKSLADDGITIKHLMDFKKGLKDGSLKIEFDPLESSPFLLDKWKLVKKEGRN